MLPKATRAGFRARAPEGWQFSLGRSRDKHYDLEHLGDLILTVTLEGKCMVQLEKLAPNDWGTLPPQERGSYYAIWGESRAPPNKHMVTNDGTGDPRFSLTMRYVKKADKPAAPGDERGVEERSAAKRSQEQMEQRNQRFGAREVRLCAGESDGWH